MTPIEKIREGLLEADWGYISEAYETLSGEKIDVSDIKKPAANTYINPEIRQAIANDILNILNEYFDEDDIETEEPVVEPYFTDYHTNNNNPSNAPLGGLRKVTEITSGDNMTEDERVMQDAVLKKGKRENRANRPQYAEHIMACESCGQNFDYNKAYPAGQIRDKNHTPKKICSKCQSKK